MARDTTLQEKIETLLYHWGINDSGDLAQEVIDVIEEHNAETLQSQS